MTDKERAELLDELRSAALYRGPEFSVCDKAADEIKRLAAENKELSRLLAISLMGGQK